MAGKKVGKFTKLWVEGYNITTSSTGVQFADQYAKHEIGGYTQDMYYLLGRADGAVTIDGYFDDTTGATHDALKSLASGNQTHIVSGVVGDNTTPALGDVTFHLNAAQATYTVNPDLNGVVGVNAEYATRGEPIEHGILLADETVTANGNSSSVDNTASTALGGAGFLHITGLSAGDTITVLIEDSPNDSAWSTIVTFTLDGTAIDAERIEVAAAADTPERYVRASWTVTGGSISFPIMVGFVRY